MSWLGYLNFVVLQWFGMRLARVMQQDFEPHLGTCKPYQVGWKLLRWVWPLTGWWSDYRWIARRS